MKKAFFVWIAILPVIASANLELPSFQTVRQVKRALRKIHQDLKIQNQERQSGIERIAQLDQKRLELQRQESSFHLQLDTQKGLTSKYLKAMQLGWTPSQTEAKLRKLAQEKVVTQLIRGSLSQLKNAQNSIEEIQKLLQANLDEKKQVSELLEKIEEKRHVLELSRKLELDFLKKSWNLSYR